MANVTLRLKLIKGPEQTIQVPRTIEIEELEDRIGTQIGGPVSGIVHQGRRLEKGRQLSDYLFLDFSQPFLVKPWQVSGYQPSIVNLSNANRQYRAERLEAHLENLMGPVPKGLAMRQRSNAMKQRSNQLRNLQTLANHQGLPGNVEGAIAAYLGGKRKKSRRGGKKSRKARQTRKRR